MKKFLLLILAISPITSAFSQADNEALKFKLNESGSHYFQATLLNQTWLRSTENNPGTTMEGNLESQSTDIGLRRTRMQLFGQITDEIRYDSATRQFTGTVARLVKDGHGFKFQVSFPIPESGKQALLDLVTG